MNILQALNKLSAKNDAAAGAAEKENFFDGAAVNSRGDEKPTEKMASAAPFSSPSLTESLLANHEKRVNSIRNNKG